MTTTTVTDSQGLCTGWEPDLSPEDTVLRRFLLHLAEYFASAAAAAGATAVHHAGMAVADLGRPSGFFNSAVLLQPPAPDRWDGVLDSLDEAFAHGTGDTYLWSAWPTPDLRPRGWQLTGHPPLLVRPPGGVLPPAAPGLEVREVRTPAGLEDWARVAVEGYPLDELSPYRPGSLLDERILRDLRWRFWVGYEDGRPVSIGTLFVSHGLAQLALGVTCRRPVDAASGPRWSASACAPSPTCSAAASSVTTAAPASSGWATCRSCASRCGTAPGGRDHPSPPTTHPPTPRR